MTTEGLTPERLNALHEDRHVYSALLSETKARLFSIKAILENNKDIHPQIVLETCNLQLRICCECVALACLAAHRSIPGSKAKKLMQQWNARELMTDLRRLHYDFYPGPWLLTSTDGGWHFIRDEDTAADFLDRDALINLWSTLGDSLHKGNLKTFVNGKKKVATSYPVLDRQIRSFEALLKMHMVMSHDRYHVIICNGMLEHPHLGVNCQLATVPG